MTFPPTGPIVDAALAALQTRNFPRPRLGLILGSGLGALSARITDPVTVRTTELPGYPKSTVEGHAGTLVGGLLAGVPVACFSGRIHGYEGYPSPYLALPIRILAGLGVRGAIVTNAAGGVRIDLRGGDLMAIRDHINLTGQSPLTGPNEERFGPRFPDQTEAWSRALRRLIPAASAASGVTVHEGVYAQVPGPQYETPAEIRMLSVLGADAVGISTVPEAIAAAHLRLPLFGLSIIANRAAGFDPEPLTHAEVLRTVDAAAGRAANFLLHFIPAMDAALAAP